MHQPLRVVFDTNVFTPEKFDILDSSAMRARCRQGRIVPIYGHTFIEETLHAYGSAAKREALVNRWVPFIRETADRFCDDFTKIWHRELTQGQGLKASPFMRPNRQRAFLRTISNIPLDGSWYAWDRAQGELKLENDKKQAQYQTSRGVRKEFAQWRKDSGLDAKRHPAGPFGKYAAKNLDYAGRLFLVANVKCINPHAVADRWAKNKWSYPYFSTFVTNMLYICFHAMIESNDKIDQNAQGDMDVMTHLLRADILVSNESGFLRSAFDEIWRPRGKILFTSEQFRDFLA